jgi:hypothetical protein
MAATAISHLHSDDGVFTANILCDDCKVKHKSQSFSGVAAKQQNVRAESVIQTIM